MEEKEQLTKGDYWIIVLGFGFFFFVGYIFDKALFALLFGMTTGIIIFILIGINNKLAEIRDKLGNHDKRLKKLNKPTRKKRKKQ